MSGEMIAIVAVGVALAGVILTSLRGTEARLGAQIKDWGEVGELRERMAQGRKTPRTHGDWKDCWKDCARPSPGGPAPANAGPRENMDRTDCKKSYEELEKRLDKSNAVR